MAHCVDTMMYVREVPWHGLGTRVEEAPNSKEALRLAGLDWDVERCPIITADGQPVPGFYCNRRNDTKEPLGIVKDRYQIVQNSEAFSFTDELIGGDVKYETAGSLLGGRKVWMLARMPAEKILGDDVVPYLCFVAGHDGMSSIRVCMTPIRVVCNNTLNLALKKAKRSWSARHSGDIATKMDDARQCLELSGTYMDALGKYADKLANTTVAREDLEDYVDELFPSNIDDSDRKRNNTDRLRAEFMKCYDAPDLKKFQGTAWGVVNAAADMATHSAPGRESKTFQENNWNRLLDGHTLIDSVVIMANQWLVKKYV